MAEATKTAQELLKFLEQRKRRGLKQHKQQVAGRFELISDDEISWDALDSGHDEDDIPYLVGALRRLLPTGWRIYSHRDEEEESTEWARRYVLKRDKESPK